MATYVYVTVEIDEAKYLADLIGVESDLKTTIEWCDKFVSLLDDRDSFWLIEPLTTAILIRFIRALGTGVRSNCAKSLLCVLTEDEKEKYENFNNIRSKHVAHSVNEFEENEVKAYYNQDAIEQGVTSIGEGHTRVIGLSGYDVEAIRNICIKLIEKIKSEKNAEKKKVLEIISNWTSEDIKKCQAKSPKRIADMDISKRRK